jgi:UDP-N-acetylmuramoylalanine--D-glutamate ligase
MGLGLHGGGIGAANYFTSLGDRVTVTDLKGEQELETSIARLNDRENIRFVLGRHDFSDFENADLVIKNPSVPPNSPYIIHARAHRVPVETDIGIFLERVLRTTSNIIGVSGTKGKSTVASLLYSIIQSGLGNAHLGGNITGSVLDIVEKVKKGDYIVLELSSFQLGGIENKKYSPHIALITNFMEDHLDYYADMNAYFRDKSIIYRFQKSGDILVLNREDMIFRRAEPAAGVELASFGRGMEFNGAGSFIEDERIYFRRGKTVNYICDENDVKLPGEHNLSNVLACVAAACMLRVSPPAVLRSVREFRGIEHRLEYAGSSKGIRFYNDSAATVPAAAVRALSSVEGFLTLIAGGSDKRLDVRELVRVINERVDHLVLLRGTGTDRLIDAGLRLDYSVHGCLEAAFADAVLHTKKGGCVLLSPGFASFGMFKNEFHRGSEFKRLVIAYIKNRRN